MICPIVLLDNRFAAAFIRRMSTPGDRPLSLQAIIRPLSLQAIIEACILTLVW
jgi:hypothetical protein